MNAPLKQHGKKVLIGIGVLMAFFLVGKILIWDWMITRKYCQIGHSLMVTRKTGDIAPQDTYADEGQQGVQKEMKGPGRHFLNPFTYSVAQVEDILVKPGQICLIKNNIGKDLPAGRFLANAGEKGTLKNVLTPGTWRINPHGQSYEMVQATIIRPGYVGVQTLRETRTDPATGKIQKKGILAETLQPGLYYINPREVKVDIVEIGYQVWFRVPEYSWVDVTDKTGKALKIKKFVKGTGVSFPLADGYMAVCLLICAVGLIRRRPWALLFGLVGGSAIIFLGLMDTLYSIQQGMFSLSTTEGVEALVICGVCLILGPATIVYLWRNRAYLL